MSVTAVRLRVEGRVQGVGFRWWTVNTAERLGLRGWTRNRRDGTVEILAIGAPEALDELQAACASGPPAAQVAQVTAAPAEDDGSAGFFERETI